MIEVKKRIMVLICDPIAKIGIDRLKEHCRVDVRPGLTEDQLKKIISAYDAAVVCGATRFPRTVMEHATSLKIVVCAGPEIDTIDGDAASEKNIAVVHSPNANPIAVAEQIIDILIEPEHENPLGLAVVPMDKVFPHELTDPRRVANLIKRIKASDVFTNPPIVVPSKDHYVVLDGATRISAFKELDFHHIIVQVLKDRSTYELSTWYHVIRKINIKTLLDLLNALPGITLVQSDSKTVQAEMVEQSGLCYLETRDRTIYYIQPDTGINQLKALNLLTDTYIQASHVSRTLHKGVNHLLKEFPDLTGVVVFPVFSLDQILQITDGGNVIPSGITRSIIPGRVMRLNANFEFLKSDKNLNIKNKWLYDLVMEKLSSDQARYYAEPIYLLDD